MKVFLLECFAAYTIMSTLRRNNLIIVFTICTIYHCNNVLVPIDQRAVASLHLTAQTGGICSCVRHGVRNTGVYCIHVYLVCLTTVQLHCMIKMDIVLQYLHNWCF